MILTAITFLTALALSVVAAYFSIVGLIAIFAAAPLSIAVMGSALEAAKLVSASWLYRNWAIAPRTLKYYLTISVVVLSLITSMGIFGYLSKAHMDQGLPTGDVQASISLLDEKIKVSKENIETNRKALKQLDDSVDQLLARSSDENGAARAAQLRRQQQPERNRLLQEIQQEQKTITSLNQERSPIAASLRKIEAEVGPIKYIAALIYGDNPDTNTLEKAVRFVIITLIFVFDPLAILLLIAANISYNIKYEPDDGPLTDEQIDQIKSKVKEEPRVNLFETTSNEQPEKEEERGWSKIFYNRVKSDPREVRIQRSKIYEVGKMFKL